MTKARETHSALETVPLNLLLGCSEKALGNFTLARWAAVADLQKQWQAIAEQLVQETAKAMLADWFRSVQRDDLKRAIENPEDIMAWAQEQIRQQGQKDDPESELLPSLPPGAAHRAAAMRYQERNVAEGKCGICPEPLDRNSVRYCTKHLTACRDRYHQKKGLVDPGSREYLYSGEITESTTGRHPNNLAALAMGREQRTRAFLAAQGIAPGSAAVSKKAAMDALLGVMPQTAAEALTQGELFTLAIIPTKTTGQRALADLLATKLIHRTGEGGKGNPFRYFLDAVVTEGREQLKVYA